MPCCSGVALGLDRVFMLLQNKDSIADVMPFDFNRC
jgi:elongation factor P--beta-lysine ligase